ncbi:threonine/serine exporter family protein [Facklamia sp. 7083-14-GEN3]|uniref:threonine/serine exporter family protein n=1 Tax=Facklamia sp. 7083-14-GEN3 TaxID=2973478 RepID=UPI00215CD667|nr:threonine/serine exporter family protein [Facklamia sp. 7083-14-GEN3]MCR8968904.1 threonine/serine exporter family protein [Facklamia sp. 7083-14-GEN3]
MRIFYKKVFKLARLAGKILLESNAEEYRVEDTTLRILQTTGLDSPSSYSNTTGLFLSLTDTKLAEFSFSEIVRINKRQNNIQHIVKVNDISRAYVSGEISVDQAYEALNNIQTDEYGFIIKYINLILIVLFVILFGGTPLDMLVAFLIGCLILTLDYWRKTTFLTDFLFNILSIALGSLTVKLIDASFPSTIHPVIILGAMIMPNYPVTSATNAMRDILKGNNLAGIIKGIDAVMVIISLTIGYTLSILLSQIILPFLS